MDPNHPKSSRDTIHTVDMLWQRNPGIQNHEAPTTSRDTDLLPKLARLALRLSREVLKFVSRLQIFLSSLYIYCNGVQYTHGLAFTVINWSQWLRAHYSEYHSLITFPNIPEGNAFYNPGDARVKAP